MWKPWGWPSASQAVALANARVAATELSRLRLEREDVELFLVDRRAELRGGEVGRAGAG